MGGTINIAARFNDGQAICVDGWTNFMSDMVLNETTLSGDDRVVRETLTEVANHKNYSGPQQFRCSGYGIVVIDFIDRTIHSKQGYTSFDGPKILASFIDLSRTGWKGDMDARLKSLTAFKTNGDMSSYEVHVKEESRGLLEAGRVIVTHSGGEPVDPYVIDEQKLIELSKEETRRFLQGENREMHITKVDLAPFNLFEYPEDGPLTDMKRHLQIADFPLTKEKGLNAMFA